MSYPERMSTAATEILAWDGGRTERRDDILAVEEPLEIRLAGYNVTVTMRTPGNDFDLAAGFLLSEGIIRGADDIASIAHCPTDDSASRGNIVNVNPADPALVDPSRWQRNFAVTSSCGICGTASIDALRRRVGPIPPGPRLDEELLFGMARRLRDAQTLFDRTGGLHAAGLFDAAGRLAVLREDVGRHNAVDKGIGAVLRAGRLPLHEHVLLVSSRASFEIVQKAAVAGIPVVATVSAASSLAVELAAEVGMTLAGFLRPDQGRLNLYSGVERLTRDRVTATRRAI